MNTCLICKFYEEKTASSGRCRRFPPQITTRVYTLGEDENRGRYTPEVESSTETEWPEVTPPDWCGEYASKYRGDIHP